jgi:cyclase
VGGGVRSCDDIDKLLRAGADNVAIGTGWAEVPGLIEQASRRFGRQAIVGSLDVSMGTVVYRAGKTMPGWNPYSKAEWLASMGAGEILLTNVERDGQMQGYDLDLIRRVSASVDIPVIAAGGCGSPEHMHEALKAGADAVAAGALFAFTDHTPRSCAQYLQKRGWEVRL